MLCASCGQENPDGFLFCGRCGASLSEARPARELRKVVTVVFCDLTGSTALGDATDPEALRATMRGYYEEMRSILERHGGTVEKFIGDAVMAVFGVPVAHEHDALRAVRAAWEMRAAVPALGLAARIGVNTGEVVTGEGDTLVTGDAVNVAARLEQAAEAGEVLIGAETQRLVRDAVRVEPVEIDAKGKTAPVAAFRLRDVDPDAAPVARRLDTPLVGRTAELEQLTQAFERATREQRCHLFTLLGAAGVGKSRLVAEFLSGLDATVLSGRCLDYGEGITFWPVVSVLKQLGPRGDETIARLSEAAAMASELFWAVRTKLEEVAAERPLVVFLDDIQWGEETFLDLVDHVADLSRGAPLLLLCVARPELLDKRPGWGGGKLNATTILLEPLSPEECGELIAASGGVEPEIRDRIIEVADGNPLFVEEMVALVREDGAVRVPSTVQALLQARIDQLHADERSVIESGAVEGQIFHRGAVVELTHEHDPGPQLAGLVRKELIQPAPATLAGDQAFRFRHLLIRDAAYDALPKETRAELHERFAGWLELHGDLVELDEVLGYHLEQAARYRRELGRADPELEAAAGRRLGEAGLRAAMRSDRPAAANLLERAVALLPADDPRRTELLVELIGSLVEHDSEGAGRYIEQLERSADRAARMHGRLARLQLRVMFDPGQVVAEAETVTAEALELFTAAGDDLGLAHAYYLIAWVNWLRSRALPAAEAYRKVQEHGARAGAHTLAGRSIIQIGGPLLFGPVSPAEAAAQLERLRRDGSTATMLTARFVEGEFAARAGRFDEALELLDQYDTLVRELGMPLGSAIAAMNRARTFQLAGRLDAAAGAFRNAIAILEALEQTSFLSTALINYAEILYQQGDRDEADRLALEGETTGATEDVVNFAFGRGLRGMIAADRGSHSEAERLAREALDYAYETDFPEVHAKAHSSLAHVLGSAGRREEARGELERALELRETYGHEVEAERTRQLLAEL